MAAADEAMKASGLQVTPEISERVGVHNRIWHRRIRRDRARAYQPAEWWAAQDLSVFIPAAIVNLAAGHVSIRLPRPGAERRPPVRACTSSAHSIGDAFKIISRCDAEVMIAGGTEAAITPMGVGGFAAMRGAFNPE